MKEINEGSWEEPKEKSRPDNLQPNQIVTCYRCGKLGHMANRCRNAIDANGVQDNANNARPSNQNYAERNNQDRKCSVCGAVSHHSDDCPDKITVVENLGDTDSSGHQSNRPFRALS